MYAPLPPVTKPPSPGAVRYPCGSSSPASGPSWTSPCPPSTIPSSGCTSPIRQPRPTRSASVTPSSLNSPQPPPPLTRPRPSLSKKLRRCKRIPLSPPRLPSPRPSRVCGNPSLSPSWKPPLRSPQTNPPRSTCGHPNPKRITPRARTPRTLQQEPKSPRRKLCSLPQLHPPTPAPRP